MCCRVSFCIFLHLMCIKVDDDDDDDAQICKARPK